MTLCKRLTALAILLAPMFTHAQDSGGDLTNFTYATAPTIYQRGYQYSTPTLTASPTPPSRSTITVMAWTWGFQSTTPSGTIVQLCYSSVTPADCFNISELPHGTTTHFAGYAAPGAAFYITFKVPGTGSQSPVLYPSNVDQLILNWQSE